MATLKAIKLRMTSIESTKQITKAMKMVSASKMRRAEENVSRARVYSEKLGTIIQNLSQGLERSAHPLLESRTGGKALVLLISTDRGLCGGLNANLCKKLVSFLQTGNQNFEQAELYAFGKKGNEYFSHRNFTIGQSQRDLKEKEYAALLEKTVNELISQYINEEYSHLYLAYNHFRNVISQIPTIKQILPIEPPREEKPSAEGNVQFIIEPSSKEVLNAILPQYVNNQVYTALLNNIACEHAARMTAMDSATNNASDMLSTLSIKYNRARQAAITSELIEIISGAAAV